MSGTHICRCAENGFCGYFAEGTRKRLCNACHIRHYAANERVPLAHWRKGGAVLLDGIMVAGSYDDKATNGFLASGIAGPGDPISAGSLVHIGIGGAGREAICITDCETALFDRGIFEELFETDAEFARILFSGTLKLCGSGEGLTLETCAHDSYAAVRYVVSFCALHGRVDLTHDGSPSCAIGVVRL